MTVSFKKAVKHESFLRMAVAGPSGSGKTFTALTLAHRLAGGKPVAVIDTERGSASKYADIFPDFDVIDLENFNPTNYIDAIKVAEQAGYGVIVIDSLSHAWNGPGGLLEIVENVSKRGNKSTFNAWGEATPLQNKLIDTITRSRLHVICTMRTKTEYVVEVNERGKSAPRKVGTSPIQRADIEYEFDVYADMDIDNNMIVHKSRCPQLSGAVIAKPDSHVADLLLEWLRGVPMPVQPPATPVVGTFDPAVEVSKLYPIALEAGLVTSKKEFLNTFILKNELIDPSRAEVQYLEIDDIKAIEALITERKEAVAQPA